jgi:SAM-dependent methyltransferase
MSNYYDGLNLKLLDAIPADAKRVLELGCANGRLGRRFKELHPGVSWWGVELMADAAATAAQFLDRVIQLDLDHADLTQLEGGFDVIVIGDLLEHVREPGRLLESLYDLATPGAQILLGGADAVPGLDRGYFVRPTLLRCDDPAASSAATLHRVEVFGPVATIMPYDDGAGLAQLVRRGGGGLVASLYSDDRHLVPQLVMALGPYHGRLFLGSARLSGQSPGPGTVLPQLNHGGPGRAGDGHELGGVRGMEFYMQRCAIQGYKPTVEGLLPRSSTPAT